MLFTSVRFAVFTGVLIVLYHILPRKFRWPLLLLASYLFYATWDKRYLIFISVTSLSAWLCGLFIAGTNEGTKALIAGKGDITKEEKKAVKEKGKRRIRAFMLVTVLLNLGILAVTKYTNFVIENINNLMGAAGALKAVDILIPMGISFYTFRTVSYVIDCARGTTVPEKNPFKVMLFTSFFPQLVQGPISRWNDLSKTLFSGNNAGYEGFLDGFMRILWGYAKKLIVADRMIVAVNCLIKNPDKYYGAYVFCAMMFYALELYCDFTGGTDITIGIAKCLGIDIKENFNLPYFSKNIKEYWNRWHITMGSWFTDYIFYPLSVSPRMLKLSKWSRQHLGNAVGKRVTVYLSCFLVWLATGIWHGAAWNFVVWGLLNFAVIMISQELEPLYARFHGRFGFKEKNWYKIFEILRTILLMSMIRMLDCYRNVPLTFKALGTMFTKFSFKVFSDGSLLGLGLSLKDYIVLGVSTCILLAVSIVKARSGRDMREILRERFPLYCASCAVLFVAIVILGCYGKGYDATQFIYNQF